MYSHTDVQIKLIKLQLLRITNYINEFINIFYLKKGLKTLIPFSSG